MINVLLIDGALTATPILWIVTSESPKDVTITLRRRSLFASRSQEAHTSTLTPARRNVLCVYASAIADISRERAAIPTDVYGTQAGAPLITGHITASSSTGQGELSSLP